MIMDQLRDIKRMQQSLSEKEATLKKELHDRYVDGDLAEFVSDDNSQKFVGDGVTVSLCSGRKKRVWDESVKQQLTRVEYEAQRLGLYKDEIGQPYWVAKLEKPL